MIRHMLFWNIAPEVADRGALLGRLRAAFAELKAACPGLVEARVDPALPGSTHDLALYCEFTDRAALDAYQEAPLHRAFQAGVRDLLRDRVCADMEVRP